MFCTQCGGANIDDARFCKHCATALQLRAVNARPISAGAVKNPGIAAVLSFFICGLGQIYNGQIFKGLVMMIMYLISWFMIIVFIGFLTTPILWIWGMVDAYRNAEGINREAAAF